MKQYRRKSRELQSIIQLYREKTGNKAVDMKKVAKFAIGMGVRPPLPVSAEDRLARELSRAAREQVRYDEVTKRPYRVNHAYPGISNGVQTTLWVDIDEAPRGPMLASLTLRRQQMVDDGYHLSLDADRWNATNSDKLPINLIFDFTDDIEERKNAPDEDQRAS